MRLRPEFWDEGLSQYLFLDRKLSARNNNDKLLKIRYVSFCAFFASKDFNRENFTEFLYLKQQKGCRNNYLNNLIKYGKWFADFLQLKYGYDAGISDFTYFKKQRVIHTLISIGDIKKIYSLEMPYTRQKEEKNFKYKTLFMLLAQCGLRINEALSLEFRDVSPALYIVIRDPKNNEDRMIPISKSLYDDLIKQPKRGILVFTNDEGQKLHKQGVADDLKRRAFSIGIDVQATKIHLHTFRHVFCTELLKAGMQIEQVQIVMGHKYIQSTVTYTHYMIEDIRMNMMTLHPLLREEGQTLEYIGKRLRDYVDKLIDRTRFSLTVNESDCAIAIRVENSND